MSGFELLIIVLIIYWLFGARVLAMVDVLSTRAHALFNHWERGPKMDNHISPYILKQVAQKRKDREMNRSERKESAVKVKSKMLVASKEHEWYGYPKRTVQQLNDTPCASCDPSSREKWKSETLATREQNVTNLLEYEEAHSTNLFVRTFSCLVKHYYMPVHNFAQILNTVLTDNRVQDAIAETTSDILSEESIPEEKTEDRYREIFLSRTRKAKAIVTDMHAAMSNFVLKLTSYVLFKLFPRFMTSVNVHPTHVEMLRRAVKTNLPIIYVPLHRSHLDYTTLIFTILNSHIKPPLTAAGINLNIPFFGFILRRLGAFYIKRRIEANSGSKDLIYRSALHTYMSQVLKAGHHIKFYIEGGRTRTGKPCLPKVGLLSIIVDAFMEGTIQDALLIPVSVNYDKLVDGNFICELMGQPKEKESFTSAMKAIWTTLNSNYGSARIDFSQPYSLRELVNSFQNVESKVDRPLPLPYADSDEATRTVESFPSSASLSSLHGTDVVREDYRVLVEQIAYHLVHDASTASAVMSTNIVAFLLLNKCRSGVKLGVLVEMFDNMRRELLMANRDIAFSGESVDVVNCAVKLLGPSMVKVERPEGSSEWDQLITPITMLPNVIELSYYGNALIPHYSLQAVVATAAFSLIKASGRQAVKDVTLSENDLMQHSLRLCELLQFEFLFAKPCQHLDDVISRTIDDFVTQGILSRNQVVSSKRWTGLDDDEDDEDAYVPPTTFSVVCDGESIERLKLYSMTIRPFIDSYVATTMALHFLVKKQMTESEYTKTVLQEIQSQINTGYFPYGECCSADSIKNACKVMKKWGVLESFTRDSIKLIYLTDSFDSLEGVRTLTEKISTYKWCNSS